MAKHPVPKRRATSRRSAVRYETFVKKALARLAKFTNLVKSPETGEKVVAHQTDKKTGTYRGRVVKPAKTKKVTKVSA